MPITVTEETPHTEIAFPKLMTNPAAGDVILFESAGNGVILKATNPSNVGTSVSGVAMTNYRDYTGKIELENA